jgi:hypothetical protein
VTIDFGSLEQRVGDAMSMDRVHVEWMLAVMQKLRPQTVVEIGCFAGVSTTAIAAAYDCGAIKKAHLIDISIQDSVRAIADARPGFSVHQSPSVVALPAISAEGDVMVVVDGDHEMQAVTHELPIVLALHPRCIVAHDVTAEAAGFSKCDGARWLWEQLQAGGWHCAVDCRRRHGASTHRGLLVACRGESDAAVARQELLTLGGQ